MSLRVSKRTAVLVAFLLLGMMARPVLADETCQRWDGQVGGRPAEICFHIEDAKITGEYFYFRYGKPIALSGDYDTATGKFTLWEAGDTNASSSIQWTGAIDDKNKQMDGGWSNGKTNLSFRFFDINLNPAVITQHEKKFYKCDDENPYDISYAWDIIDAFPNADLKDKLNAETKSTMDKKVKEAETAIFSEYPQEPGFPKYRRRGDECVDDAGVEDAKKRHHSIFKHKYSSIEERSIRPFGKFIIELRRHFYDYSGGAHGYGGSKVEYYDLRTANKLGLDDLLNEDGRNALIKTITHDVADMGCKTNININLNDGSLSSPVRHNNKRKEQESEFTRDLKNLNKWSIDFGSDAFGCTGLHGYNLDRIPPGVIERGLNSEFFDSQTKFFYE